MLSSFKTNRYEPSLPTIYESVEVSDAESRPENPGERFRRESDEIILANMIKETKENSRFNSSSHRGKKAERFPGRATKTPSWFSNLSSVQEG